MSKQDLYNHIRDDIKSLDLQSTRQKIQKIQAGTNALSEVLKVYRKNRNIKVLLEFCNGNPNGHASNTATNSSDHLVSKVKAERDSTKLQDVAMNSLTAPTINGTSFVKEEACAVFVEMGSIKEEPNLMPPPTTRPKRGRKKAIDKASFSSSDISTSTRSSARSTRSNSVGESDVICTDPDLECLTVSDEESNKSEKDATYKPAPLKRARRLESESIKTGEMPPPPPTRSARTKRNQKKTEDINNTVTLNKTENETDSIIHNKTSLQIDQKTISGVKCPIEIEFKKPDNERKVDDGNKRLRNPPSSNVKKNKSDSCGEANISGETVYEDAADITSKFKMNAMVMLVDINVSIKPTVVNETFVKDESTSTQGTVGNVDGNSKSPPANETIIVSQKPPNETFVVDKKTPVNEDFNGLDDIMTDDESLPLPLPTKVTKSKVAEAAPSSQSKALKKTPSIKSFDNGSPVKKLVQVFEKMGKYGGAGSDKDRDTPSAARHMKNITPTQQNRLYTALGSASKTNTYIPISASKTVAHNGNMPDSCSATASSIKRSQQEYQEREILRRQKEEEARKKREQHLQAQAEERKKRVDAQDLKRLQVQKKKELLKQEKLHHLDEIQRMKEEKARLVLQEKQDKLKEDMEKKRQRYKKHDEASSKPIYMIQHMPLLTTTDCYDSDEENVNVKTVRVRPPWTTREKLIPKLRLMATLDDPTLRNGLFATKPTTPNLLDIFQDIDPVKLGRTSSAVWRKPPRFTLMHLPSFTEENENAE